MTHEEKEAIRERQFMAYGWVSEPYPLKQRPNVFVQVVKALDDIPALLAALDKADARIEALERVIKSEDHLCEFCINKDVDPLKPPCSSCIGRQGRENWQFKEAADPEEKNR